MSNRKPSYTTTRKHSSIPDLEENDTTSSSAGSHTSSNTTHHNPNITTAADSNTPPPPTPTTNWVPCNDEFKLPYILSWKNLIVPLAKKWKANDEILDGNGSPVIKILGQDKCATASGPAYSASIGLPGSADTVLAYVERQSNQNSLKDNFHLITIAVHLRNKDDSDNNNHNQQEEEIYYIHGKITQGIFGREYTYSRRNEDGTAYIPIMKARNSWITLSAFPGLYLPFLCNKKFRFKFYSVKHPERLLFTRDQKEEFVEFGSKISITEAVCLAYAIDRLTNPCNRETFQSSQLAYRGNFKFQPGIIRGGHAIGRSRGS